MKRNLDRQGLRNPEEIVNIPELYDISESNFAKRLRTSTARTETPVRPPRPQGSLKSWCAAPDSRRDQDKENLVSPNKSNKFY